LETLENKGINCHNYTKKGVIMEDLRFITLKTKNSGILLESFTKIHLFLLRYFALIKIYVAFKVPLRFSVIWRN
jgi:hypothetical protein